MLIKEERLKEILVEPGHLSEQEFLACVKKSTDEKIQLDAAILSSQLIEDTQLGQLIAQEAGFPFADLRNEKVDEKVLARLPEKFARTRLAVIFGQEDGYVKAAMNDPTDLEAAGFMQKKAGCNIKRFYATEKDILSAIKNYKTDYIKDLEVIIGRMADRKAGAAKDDSAILFLNKLIEYSFFAQASDIHIEPFKGKTVVRIRVDGLMRKVVELPTAVSAPIISRIKIMSRIRTDEHRAALDGKFRFEADEAAADIRVSIVPVVYGENAVLRILSEQKRGFGIANLGFSDKQLKLIKNTIRKPHGMILVTGPTGCGKTTTLYEILKLLNAPEVHIATIEDPVEYDIEGVSQIQVNMNTNLTFAKGLRAIVRQDPDIVMVGEIRDEETASIAVNSAMTGHLVLSTLHTNDAATAIPRLLDLGVEPFLLASTLEIAIAQRLVRKICEKCRASYSLGEEEMALLDADPAMEEILKKRNKKLDKITLFKGVGCNVCSRTGYRGRIGIFEILEIRPEIKNLIIGKSSSDAISQTACKFGMRQIFEDGIDKVFSGITTLSEVSRAAREE